MARPALVLLIALRTNLVLSTVISDIQVSPRSLPPSRALATGEPETSWGPNEQLQYEQWQKFAGKGNWLQCLLDATLPAARRLEGQLIASSLTGTVDELELWGWTEGYIDQEDDCTFEEGSPRPQNNIASALHNLGIDTKAVENGGHNRCFALEHGIGTDEDWDGPPRRAYDRIYHVGGREYHRSGGFYTFAINQADGGKSPPLFDERDLTDDDKVIFAIDLKSPMVEAKRTWPITPTLDMMPAARVASDIFWAYWLRDHPYPSNLRYYVVPGVENVETRRIIDKILQGAGHAQVPHWPGYGVWMNSANGQALLGCPLGTIIGYLLFQHKQVLGVKRVRSITMFRDDSNSQPAIVNLLYSIEDVPNPDEDDVVLPREALPFPVDVPTNEALSFHATPNHARNATHTPKSIVRFHKLLA